MDRDYMHERASTHAHNQPFRPREEKETSLVWIVLFWVALLFVMFQGYSWYDQKQRASRSQARASVPVSRPAPTPAPRAPTPQQREPEQLRPLPSTARELAAPRVAVPAPQTMEIYLCRAYDGGTFWAQAHCGQHRALIERIARVPGNLPFEQQVAVARQQRDATARLVSAPAQNAVATENPVALRKVRCDALEEGVRRIDDRARQPLSGQEQDRLAAKRKELRDEQFRLRC